MNTTRLKNIILKDRMPNFLCDHPGMISNAERSLLFNLTKNHYKQRGFVIDAGAFLGASTVCFSQGLIEAKIDGKGKILSFEKGVVRQNFKRFVEKYDLPPHHIGESFQETFLALTNNHNHNYKILFADITSYFHLSENKIEIAFLDLLKTEKVCRHCITQFYPSLLVGSYVIQQDYFFDQLPFIKYTQEAFGDFFSYEGQVNSSAVFRLIKPITKDDVNKILNNIKMQDAISLHIQAENKTLNVERAYFMKLSRSWLLADLGRLEEAKEHYKKTRGEFFSKNTYSVDIFKKDFEHRHNLLESYFTFMESWGDKPYIQGGKSSWESFIYKDD